VSREDEMQNHCNKTLPDLNTLLSKGHKKQKLRAHSEYYWNEAVNDWAMTHWEWADIMCELKSKQLGAHKFFERKNA
jgi:hypothetical protein